MQSGVSMKISVVSSALALLLVKVQSFSVVPRTLTLSTGEKSTTCISLAAEAPCEIPVDAPEFQRLTDIDDGGKLLRSAVVTNIDGDFVPLSRPMGKGTSIVVFLRHMG